jgi:YegS/Rv2252/BmrU family lipid kinase
MADRTYHIIFNSTAGTAAGLGLTTASLGEMFAAAGMRFTIDDSDAIPLADRIKSAIEGPADTIVAAGGDGTVLAVAEALVGSDKPLAVLPLGTFNGLARDLRLPLELKAAIDVLPSLEPTAIDVAEMNGRPFLHNVLIGLIPNIAVGREYVRHKPGLGAMLGFIRFFLRRLARSRRIALALQAEDQPARVERLQTIMIANNSYEQRFGRFMTRRRIDRGTLTVYIIRSLKLGDVVRLAISMSLGRWRDDPVIEYESAKRLVITSKKARLPLTMDGEILIEDTPLVFTVRPKSLQVLAPPQARPADATTPVKEAEGT